jgi:hypothetical protein
MRRLVTSATIVVIALLVAAAPAGAIHRQSGDGFGFDLTAGVGAIEAGPIAVKLAVIAYSGPQGEFPRGHLAFRGNPPPFGDVDIIGRVTCLNVSGSQATVGFRVTKSRAGFPLGTNGEFSIFDAGEPGTLDRFEGRPTAFNLPSTCPLFDPANTITDGNFIVYDGAP